MLPSGFSFVFFFNGFLQWFLFVFVFGFCFLFLPESQIHAILLEMVFICV